MTRRAFLGALALVLAPTVPVAAEVAARKPKPRIPAGFSGGFYSGFAERKRA